MLKTIKIGEKHYDMRASALTAIIYKSLFGKDLISQLQETKETKTNLDLFKELAFVMCWQAEPKQMKTTEALKSLSMSDYYEWIDEIEEMDFYNEDVLREITLLWLSNQQSIVPLKKAVGQQ